MCRAVLVCVLFTFPVAVIAQTPPTLILAAEGHVQPIKDMAITADERTMVTICDGQRLCSWNLETGRMNKLVHLRATAPFRNFVVHPRGDRLALLESDFSPKSRYSKIWFFKLPDLQLDRVVDCQSPMFKLLGFLEEPDVIACKSLSGVAFLEPTTGVISSKLPSFSLNSIISSNGGSRGALVWLLPGGKKLAAAHGAGPKTAPNKKPDTVFEIYDLPSCKSIYTRKIPSSVSDGVFDRDHQVFAFRTDFQSSGCHLAPLTNERSAIVKLAPPKTSQSVLIGMPLAFGGPQGKNLVYAWRGASENDDDGDPLPTPLGIAMTKAELGSVNAIAAMPPATSQTPPVPMMPWFEEKGTGSFPIIRPSPNGKLIAWTSSRENAIHLFDAKTGERVRTVLAGNEQKSILRAGWGTGNAIGWSHAAKAVSYPGLDFSKDSVVPAAQPALRGAMHQWEQYSVVPFDTGFDVNRDKELLYRRRSSFRVGEVTLAPNKPAYVVASYNRLGVYRFSKPNVNVLDLEIYPRVPGKGILSVSPSSDGRFLLTLSQDGLLRIISTEPIDSITSDSRYSRRTVDPLVTVCSRDGEWIAWTKEGYYAASPGGEKLIGWLVDHGTEQLPTYHPAERFRSSLYRPDVIAKVLQLGSVEKAIDAANKKAGMSAAVRDITEILPPKVRIQTPSDPVVLLTSTGKLEIEAVAEPSASNPVEALQLMVENRPYQGEKGLVRSGGAKADKVVGRWNLELTQPGNYHVYVRAEGKLSNGASNVILVNYTPKAGSLAVRSRLHLLNIGVDDYPGDLQLKCAVNDARGIQSSLEKFAGPLYEIQSHSLLNGEATRGRILDKLALFQKDAAADDLVIVYYAGHGFRGPDKQFYLQPFAGRADAAAKTCLSAKELRDAIVNIRSRKVVMIVDACHGGAPGELVRELADEGCGAGVLCAAADNEKAGERGQHGFFTLALMEALEGKSLPPMAKDRRVLLSDIPSYVVRRVRELSDERQNPVCLVTGQFALTRP